MAMVERERGDTGSIRVSLKFARQGSLTKANEDRDVQAGIRPICQSTKLLHKDPVVRKMAEQSLLVLGRAGKEYLDSARTKASPELKRAIADIWGKIISRDEKRSRK